MRGKLRHLLVFLLIILKEPNMPEARCRWAPSSLYQCSKMGLTSIPQDLPIHLKKLYLSENKIKNIQPGTFANLSQLQELHLNYNQIKEIQPGVFANLSRLDWLDLSINQIRTIPPGSFANLPRLRLLKLVWNRIIKLQAGAFANLPSLTKLVLTLNQITMIHTDSLANLTQLNYLFLDSNRITMIQPGAFAHLHQLQQLKLGNNQISVIRPGVFTYLTKLYLLQLTSNKMRVIPPLDGLLASIRHMQLDKNPWQCDCRMLPFRLNTTEFPSFIDQIVCAQPAELKKRKLIDVDPEELICDKPTLPTPTVHMQVTSNHCMNCTTVGSRVDSAGNTQTIPLATTPRKTENSSSHTDIKVTSNSCYNGTTIGSTVDFYFIVGASGKASKTRATLTLSTTPNETESNSSPESAPSFPIPVLAGSVSGSIAGIVFIGAIIFTIWFKKRNKSLPPGPSSGHNSNISLRSTNTKAVAVNGSQDHQYEDVDNQHDQTGQGQSQANAEALTVGKLSHNVVLAALKPNPLYSGVGTPPQNKHSICGHNQTEQGQSQAITKLNTNIKATVTSDDDHQYEDVDKQHNQTEQGQSQTINKSNTNTTATAVTSGHDHTYEDINQHNQQQQGNFQAIAKSNKDTTVIETTSGHDHQYENAETQHGQSGRDQSQAIAESLDVRNNSYGTGPTASQPNPLYKVGSSESHPISLYQSVGQYQAITHSPK